MDLIYAVYGLLFVCVWLITFSILSRFSQSEVHLPADIKEHAGYPGMEGSGAGLKRLLTTPANLIDSLSQRSNFLPLVYLELFKKKLLNAGKPLNINQFLALKVIVTFLVPFLLYLFIPSMMQPLMLLAAGGIGFICPDIWLNSKVSARQRQIIRDLPYIIELMNICVSSGLDFMVAVTRVTQEFRSCALTDELGLMMREIQMGSSRRDALKNLAQRINSPEVSSFVLTLLQADRMGTPIGKILKSQAEEMRVRRFQKGEEQALKAPIKLLFPLLFFVMPVVLIVVAGPILIQFLYGGLKLY